MGGKASAGPPLRTAPHVCSSAPERWVPAPSWTPRLSPGNTVVALRRHLPGQIAPWRASVGVGVGVHPPPPPHHPHHPPVEVRTLWSAQAVPSMGPEAVCPTSASRPLQSASKHSKLSSTSQAPMESAEPGTAVGVVPGGMVVPGTAVDFVPGGMVVPGAKSGPGPRPGVPGDARKRLARMESFESIESLEPGQWPGLSFSAPEGSLSEEVGPPVALIRV